MELRKELGVSTKDIIDGLSVVVLFLDDGDVVVSILETLGVPLKIHVEPGDLVMLCVQKPHAAVGFMDGTRISSQCFIQYRLRERLLIDI
jgi:hypothetical protein